MTTDLTPQQIANLVEGLLFVASEPVSVKHLAAVLDCPPAHIEAGLEQFRAGQHERGIRLQRQGNWLQLVTAPELADTIEKFLGLTFSGKFSAPALETLAIIAYRQPITRPEIDSIRGVNSDGVLRTLISKGLIEEIGRLETVGHPTLFATTFEFLRYFGLESLEQLPELELPQLPLPHQPRVLEEENQSEA